MFANSSWKVQHKVNSDTCFDAIGPKLSEASFGMEQFDRNTCHLGCHNFLEFHFVSIVT